MLFFILRLIKLCTSLNKSNFKALYSESIKQDGAAYQKTEVRLKQGNFLCDIYKLKLLHHIFAARFFRRLTLSVTCGWVRSMGGTGSRLGCINIFSSQLH
jgi:hypothetical protein